MDYGTRRCSCRSLLNMRNIPRNMRNILSKFPTKLMFKGVSLNPCQELSSGQCPHVMSAKFVCFPSVSNSHSQKKTIPLGQISGPFRPYYFFDFPIKGSKIIFFVDFQCDLLKIRGKIEIQWNKNQLNPTNQLREISQIASKNTNFHTCNC